MNAKVSRPATFKLGVIQIADIPKLLHSLSDRVVLRIDI